MSNFPLKVDFKTRQAEFSAYIRDPAANTCPSDVAPKRMQVYRELFYNNVESFLSSNFPVLRKISNDSQWHQLVQDFFANHPCTSPFFSEIPEEFIIYLQNERKANQADYPFMLELAHYEWVEMAISISLEQTPDTKKTSGFKQRIRISPLAWPLAYQFPVHKISPDYLPMKVPDQTSYLVVYRDNTDEVKFIELSPMSFHLLQTIQNQQPMSISDCLTTILSGNPSESLQHLAKQALEQFIDKQIILV